MDMDMDMDMDMGHGHGHGGLHARMRACAPVRPLAKASATRAHALHVHRARVGARRAPRPRKGGRSLVGRSRGARAYRVAKRVER
eukprot:5756639-Prymnesium_polylepis.1